MARLNPSCFTRASPIKTMWFLLAKIITRLRVVFTQYFTILHDISQYYTIFHNITRYFTFNKSHHCVTSNQLFDLLSIKTPHTLKIFIRI